MACPPGTKTAEFPSYQAGYYYGYTDTNTPVQCQPRRLGLRTRDVRGRTVTIIQQGRTRSTTRSSWDYSIPATRERNVTVQRRTPVCLSVDIKTIHISQLQKSTTNCLLVVELQYYIATFCWFCKVELLLHTSWMLTFVGSSLSDGWIWCNCCTVAKTMEATHACLAAACLVSAFVILYKELGR